MFFRQLFDQTSSTYSYLLADAVSREAVLIDPVLEQHGRDAALLRELGLQLRYTLDTHCHADHLTGAWLMHGAFGSEIGLSPAYGATHVDLALAACVRVGFGAESLEVRETPGHTAGDVSLVTADRRMVFTGDALMIRAAGRTDFQQGDPGRLYRSIREQLFSLPDDCLLYPGHDYQGRTASTIGEEKRFNVRIGGGVLEDDFVRTMRALSLPRPKLMDVAVPANLRCGAPESGTLG